MTNDDAKQWRCTECEETFISTPEPHSMDSCPCGDAWVDHEQYALRRSFDAERVEDDE